MGFLFFYLKRNEMAVDNSKNIHHCACSTVRDNVSFRALPSVLDIYMLSSHPSHGHTVQIIHVLLAKNCLLDGNPESFVDNSVNDGIVASGGFGKHCWHNVE